ncbi:ABC transporter ATP-binding protein [Mycoplasmopsis pullorum]|uniref:ABC transporter ATP-binding protein n=1 Tax=Mycoplasmopsis pullorum TaxID=48003 RepID=UPI0011194DA7|nr:ABC transporter ATP-binding protein [Mycoplasmopsis pullorum]TNK82326.1 ABC transporter ATP-binding protein [Mycoplasmopsis pullorum]TNK82693.1 ABC transporter ATP-binding protein [Mycoplasmopsis pullorum]TNK84278.1 ABC transporter ATP-binding protein [Mycoplasmopsis pullorum]TNK84740.1 ABC transporter ATP-binding protein [Mycoplasmopsis pullorum]TNK85865.1 ABC transporter ATP-binding protein [Mycoplasmopsis pullorum]
MIKMFKLLPKDIKYQFYFGVVVIFFNVIISLILPLFISQFLKILLEKDPQKIIDISIFNTFIIFQGVKSVIFKKLIITVIILILLAVITSLSGVVITTWAGEKSSEFFRNRTFQKIQRMSLKDLGTLTHESLITRVSNDVAVFWEFITGATSTLIRAPLLIVGGIVFSLLTDLSLSLSIFFIIPLMSFVVYLIIKKSMPLMEENQKVIDNLTKVADENILGARLIKSFNLYEKQSNKFNEVNDKWLKIQIKTNNLFSLGNPLFFSLINIVVAFIYIIASQKVRSGVIDTNFLTNVNVFIEYMFNISFGILLLSMFLGVIFRARVSCRRILEVLNWQIEDLEITNGIDLSQNNDALGIKVKNLNFKFYSESPELVLENINFDLKPRQTLGIIGPTGSGKSTLVNLIMNNYKYNDGQILINDIDLQNIQTKSLRQNVGIVYQEPMLYSGTIKSNLLFAKQDANENEIKESLENSCGIDFVRTFEDKIDHKIEQRGKNLSGGQKQRLSIARTLLLKPKILILDDSTSALDNITTKRLLSNIKKYNATTIIISQKINSIKHADQIMVLEKGKITGLGSHEQLIESNDWYKEIYLNQLDLDK